jgi:ClpP class serine protease
MTSNPLMAQFTGEPLAFPRANQKQIVTLLGAVATHPHFQEMMVEQAGYNDDGFWPDPTDWRACLRPYNVSAQGILQIPVRGVLLHNFAFAYGNYATGYEYIWRAFQRGVADFEAGTVKGIAFVEHSPGGVVAGLYDAIDKIVALKEASGVPVRAFASEMAYSAAYPFFAISDRGYVSQTGGVGSIGTMWVHEDWSKWNQEFGVNPTYLTEGKFKADANPDEPLSDHARATMQARLKELNEIFVATVARGRGLDAQAIRNMEADIFTATQAVSNGLADEIGSLDDAMAAFAADLSSTSGDETMSDNVDGTVTQAAHESAVADALKQGEQAGTAAGVTAERQRIAAIKELEEAQTRPIAADTVAMTTDMTVEAAKAFLAKMPEEAKAPASTEEQKPGGHHSVRRSDERQQPERRRRRRHRCRRGSGSRRRRCHRARPPVRRPGHPPGGQVRSNRHDRRPRFLPLG